MTKGQIRNESDLFAYYALLVFADWLKLAFWFGEKFEHNLYNNAKYFKNAYGAF